MNNLEEKLRDILLSRTLGMWTRNADGEFVAVNWDESPVIGEFVGEIKRAVKDADYEPYATHVKQLHQHLKEVEEYCRLYVITGQAWFDAYEADLQGEVFNATGSLDDVSNAIDRCRLAARRAAGLEPADGEGAE